MTTFHLSGYPRIGAKRELKFAVEAFWKGAKSEAELQQVAADIRRANWATQKAAGADLLPVGDFSFYDHVLDLLCAGFVVHAGRHSLPFRLRCSQADPAGILPAGTR